MKDNHPGPAFDKDWQQSRGSRKRLKQISKHFLSERQPSPNKPVNTIFLPIFVENTSHKQASRHIIEALAVQYDCTLLNIDRELQKTESVYSAKSEDDMLKRLNEMVSRQAQTSRLALVELNTHNIALIKHLRRIVIPVTATLEGIRKAYLIIKQLHKMADPEFSIVMLNTNNSRDSQMYFEKLAAGTLRFLDLHILYNGYIPNDTRPTSNEGQSYWQEIMTGLASRVIKNHCLFVDGASSGSTKHMAFNPFQK